MAAAAAIIDEYKRQKEAQNQPQQEERSLLQLPVTTPRTRQERNPSPSSTRSLFLQEQERQSQQQLRQRSKSQAKSKPEEKKLQVIEADPWASVCEETCTICCADIEEGDKIYKLNCGHTFHKACIDPWLKKSSECPNCRCDVFAKPTSKPEFDIPEEL